MKTYKLIGPDSGDVSYEFKEMMLVHSLAPMSSQKTCLRNNRIWKQNKSVSNTSRILTGESLKGGLYEDMFQIFFFSMSYEFWWYVLYVCPSVTLFSQDWRITFSEFFHEVRVYLTQKSREALFWEKFLLYPK